MGRLTVSTFRKMKEQGEKIAMLTVCDATSAAMAAASGVEMLLVGDSLAMTVLGYENTLPMTCEEMLHHVKAVRRGAPEAFVIADMPFMSYQIDRSEALRNAGRFVKEGLANAVKLEGGAEYAELTRALVGCGIPVLGHIGLLPQSIQTAGGYKRRGKDASDAARLLEDARMLEDAGAFAVVLECLSAPVSGEISRALSIPTIGIGAGLECDGQVQVFHDALGLFEKFTPKHARRYAELGRIGREAIASYVAEVKNGSFPGPENSFS